MYDFYIFTAVTMKNVIFWDIKGLVVPHRRHITSPLQSSSSSCYVRFEGFVGVSIKNPVFWYMKAQFIPDRKHITSPLQSPAG
jgi:hypothetical protein